jgi:hypothetical protein
MTHGAVRVWLRIERLVAMVLSLWFYAEDSGGWELFAWLHLVLDQQNAF